MYCVIGVDAGFRCLLFYCLCLVFVLLIVLIVWFFGGFGLDFGCLLVLRTELLVFSCDFSCFVLFVLVCWLADVVAVGFAIALLVIVWRLVWWVPVLARSFHLRLVSLWL